MKAKSYKSYEIKYLIQKFGGPGGGEGAVSLNLKGTIYHCVRKHSGTAGLFTLIVQVLVKTVLFFIFLYNYFRL